MESAKPEFGQPLTDRELITLAHIANGETNHRIATKLKVRSRTLETIISSIKTKLGGVDRANCVSLGYLGGLLKRSEDSFEDIPRARYTTENSYEKQVP